jgi:hypothetical protein
MSFEPELAKEECKSEPETIISLLGTTIFLGEITDTDAKIIKVMYMHRIEISFLEVIFSIINHIFKKLDYFI